MSVGYQRTHTDGYPELFDAATSANAQPDYEALIADLSSRGVGGLGNGLSENENRRLLATDDVDELIALLLRGLFRDRWGPGLLTGRLLLHCIDNEHVFV